MMASNKEQYAMLAYSLMRFSSSEQRKGDSIRRQIALRDAYLERKKLPLDATLSFPPDKASSAFRSCPRMLMLFLEACRANRVRPGSVLIVENLDRLSRQELDLALRQFLEILDFGIRLVTLEPEQEFSKPVNLMQLMLAIIELSRGHSESAAKSFRQRSYWQGQRDKLAGGGKLLTRLPAWLSLVNGQIVADTRKVLVIQRIFTLLAGGYGFQRICKLLNAEGVVPIGKSRIWHQSYLFKLLQHRALLGEFQPRRVDDTGKRVRVGSPIMDYYPRVVSDQLWHAATQACASRRQMHGLISPHVSNLFTDLVYLDGERLCVRTSRYVAYLVNARQESLPLRYQVFERVLLLWLGEVKITLGDNGNFARLEAQRDDLRARCQLLESRVATDVNLSVLLDQLSAFRSQLADVERAIQLAILPTQAHVIQGKQLIELLASAPEQERESLRRQLKQVIRLLLERVDVRILGAKRHVKQVVCTVRFRDGKTREIGYTYSQAGLQKAWAQGYLGCELQTMLFMNNKQTSRRAEIQELLAGGLSHNAVAARFGVHRVTLYKWLRK